MTTVIAIDPGQSTGIAIFANGSLAIAETFSGGVPSHLMPFARGASLVYERPVDRKGNRVDPNDLITLAIRLGIVVGQLQAYGSALPSTAVEPQRWKGQLPKTVCHARIEKVLAPPELSIFRSVGHDGKDAVGIGLWFLSRFGVG